MQMLLRHAARRSEHQQDGCNEFFSMHWRLRLGVVLAAAATAKHNESNSKIVNDSLVVARFWPAMTDNGREPSAAKKALTHARLAATPAVRVV
ncbi:MAG TPA: hypothetical protein VHN17_12105 [Steroidobacteraceae bacterium]|nr:hypothetical protein [Steroidobacteraceae bacterium]